MSAEILRRAADVMEGFGVVHAAIAEGLRVEAARIESGEQAEPEPESLDLAHAYLGDDS